MDIRLAAVENVTGFSDDGEVVWFRGVADQSTNTPDWRHLLPSRI